MWVSIHSSWAFFTLFMLAGVIGHHLAGFFMGRKYRTELDLRLALFTLIVFVLQILLGVITYLTSPHFHYFKDEGMGYIMKNPDLRLIFVEHPVMNLIALLFLLYGFRRMFYQIESKRKFLSIIIFYGLGLLLVLSRIPWKNWL